VVSGSHTINPGLYKKLPFDSVRDFAPVAMLVTGPGLLVVHPSLPARNVRELIALARAQRGGLLYASAGNGNTSHLSVELFKTQTDTKMIHIPYKGSGPAVIAMLGNEVSFMFDSISTSFQQVKTGKLKAIAVSSLKRVEILPDTPTIAETLPGFEVTVWYGILAPAGTPANAISRISQAFAEVAAEPKVRSQLAESGYSTIGSTPAVFGALIENELIKWNKAVKDSGATAN
jgi:tripartite-type tricarboxylate transporter receptor subunit TctC